jgi:hypothetical protein
MVPAIPADGGSVVGDRVVADPLTDVLAALSLHLGVVEVARVNLGMSGSDDGPEGGECVAKNKAIGTDPVVRGGRAAVIAATGR